MHRIAALERSLELEVAENAARMEKQQQAHQSIEAEWAQQLGHRQIQIAEEKSQWGERSEQELSRHREERQELANRTEEQLKQVKQEWSARYVAAAD